MWRLDAGTNCGACSGRNALWCLVDGGSCDACVAGLATAQTKVVAATSCHPKGNSVVGFGYFGPFVLNISICNLLLYAPP